MTSLVFELQQEALNPDVSVSVLLRKALVLSRKLNIKEFENWVTAELSGYQNTKNGPRYRTLRGEVKAFNPYQGWIPLFTDDAAFAERLATRFCDQGAAELESLIKSSEGHGTLQMPFSKAIEASLMEDAEFPFKPTLLVSRASIVAILDGARNTVLNWSLQLEKDGIVGQGLSFSNDEKKRAAEHTYNVNNFYGDVSGSQIQQASNHSAQNLTTQISPAALASFVGAVRGAVPALPLQTEQKVQLSAELATLDEQSKLAVPDTGKVRESLRTVRNLVEGIVGNLLAAGILAEIAKLLGP